MNLQERTEQILFMQELITKALADSDYKERLIENPEQAIQEVYPDFKANGKKIVVQDQTDPNASYLNISLATLTLLRGDQEELELTQEELELVAGGVAADSWCIFSSIGDITVGGGNNNGNGNTVSTGR